MGRVTGSTIESVSGGCNRCTKRWSEKNAQALAAQHHDKTGHQTWVKVTRRIVYGAALGKTSSREARLL